MSTVLTKTVIAAEVHSDDRLIEVAFDAEAWFEAATDEEIFDLASIGWGGDDAADSVAQWFREYNDEIEQLFDYLNLRNKYERAHVGFEVHIDENAALTWLAANKPTAYRSIYKQAV